MEIHHISLSVVLAGKMVVTVIDPFSFTDRLVHYPRPIVCCLIPHP
jgi:hypothetical protein